MGNVSLGHKGCEEGSEECTNTYEGFYKELETKFGGPKDSKDSVDKFGSRCIKTEIDNVLATDEDINNKWE